MRRTAGLLVVVFCLVLGGCGGDAPNVDPPKTEKPAATSTTETPKTEETTEAPKTEAPKPE
jgi:multidrug efflux pump subunit AcrA (membrane-fusion protein)